MNDFIISKESNRISKHMASPCFTLIRTLPDPLQLRSGQLKQRVEEALVQTGASKVHIIAHSMGGLDSRRMIVDLGMADKVASLTTIGTPHRGTILADHVLKHGGVLLMDFLNRITNVDGFN